MNKFIAILFLGFALCACSEAQTEGECVGDECGERLIMGGETNVPGVLVGMTRDEVIGVLGNNFESYNGFDRPPFVDSFPYIKGGRTRYIQVQYHRGTVSYANPGFEESYRVY